MRVTGVFSCPPELDVFYSLRIALAICILRKDKLTLISSQPHSLGQDRRISAGKCVKCVNGLRVIRGDNGHEWKIAAAFSVIPQQ